MMEVTYETYSKTVTRVKWNVAIPRGYDGSETKEFLVNGARWKLSLSSNIYIASYAAEISIDEWIMYLIGDFKTKFPLILYMQHEGNNIFLNTVTITSSRTEIWRCTYSSFKSDYPNISITGSAVLFILDFPPDNGSHGNSPGELESAAKAEIYPCLESLSCDLSKQMDETADADVQLTCGDVTIRAHKFILAARSEVFRSMLRSDMLEGRKGVVEIVDMEPKVLEIFIRYAYTGTLPELTEDAILSLYEAANKYKIDGLRKRSIRLLSANLSQEKALRILVIADAHGDKDLKSRVFSYMADEQDPIDTTEKKENWLKFCNDYPKLVVEFVKYVSLSDSQ